MAVFVVFAVCSLFFFSFAALRRRRHAIIFWITSSGYLVLTYFYYFGGGWKRAGNSHPFNQDLIFAFLLLTSVAVLLGFGSFLRRYYKFGEEGLVLSRIKSFAFSYFGFLLVAGLLVVSVPLSFEMPVDFSLCLEAEASPSYCDD